MRRLIAVLAAVAAASMIAWQSPDPVWGDGSRVLVIEIDGAIDPLSADHIARGIDEARGDDASLVVIRLDTPGGLLESTREIVELLLDSDVPVAVYVSPAGARAASAGTFVAAAANFAVMAPGTNIGAASPVTGSGRDLPATLSRKIGEDTRAFIRSIAQTRGRNADALEDTVSKATAYSAQEALDVGIVDLLAPDMQAMLAELHGRTAETAAGPVVISSAGAQVDRLDRTLLEHALGILANPNVTLALFLIGGVAVLAEASVPGMFGPGIVGAIALALAFIGYFNLPGSWVGLALIALAMVLFYAETTAPGFSVFGAGGIVSLILGSVLLFGNFFSPSDLPEPSFMVSPITIAVVTGLMTAAWVLFIRLAGFGGGVSSGFQTEEESLLEGARGVALSDPPAGRQGPGVEQGVVSVGRSRGLDPGRR